MRATVWTLVVITLLLGLMGWGGSSLSRSAAQSFFQEAQQLEDRVLQGDWAQMIQILEAFENRWTDTCRWLQLWIDHGDTEAVTLALARIRAGALLQDASLTMDAIAELKAACLHLHYRNDLRLQNLI